MAALAAVLLCGALVSAYFAWSEQRLAEDAEAAPWRQAWSMPRSAR